MYTGAPEAIDDGAEVLSLSVLEQPVSINPNTMGNRAIRENFDLFTDVIVRKQCKLLCTFDLGYTIRSK